MSRLAVFLHRLWLDWSPKRWISDCLETGQAMGFQSAVGQILPAIHPNGLIHKAPDGRAFPHLRVLSALSLPGFDLQQIVVPPPALEDYEEASLQLHYERTGRVRSPASDVLLAPYRPTANGIPLAYLRQIPYGTYVLVVRAKEPA